MCDLGRDLNHVYTARALPHPVEFFHEIRNYSCKAVAPEIPVRNIITLLDQGITVCSGGEKDDLSTKCQSHDLRTRSYPLKSRQMGEIYVFIPFL